MNKLMKIGLVAVLFAVAFASCVPQKKMLYLKDVQMATETISKEYVNDRTLDYKLQPGDNLYIRFLNTIDQTVLPRSPAKIVRGITCHQRLASICNPILWIRMAT